ncbi:MAG: Hsp33 family molecular chaperone HslO [Pseudomonadota bacterium]
MIDDLVASFSLDAGPVRGRVVRLGAAVDAILRRHDYPAPVAMLLGEALTLAALVGSLLKVEGKLSVQAQGDGAVRLLVAEYRSDGGLRGYARLADGASEMLTRDRRLPPAALLRNGRLVLTLDQGDDAPPHQGVVALQGDTLAVCAENYFRVSEQTETRIRLAVGEAHGPKGPPVWRAGGMLLQRIAGDAARGDTEEDWSRATILFQTVGDDELIDPGLPADRLLYRLFHEEGARMGVPAALADRCTCNAERLTSLMRTFSAEEVADLVEPDGMLHARCQFCAREYLIAPESLPGV